MDFKTIQRIPCEDPWQKLWDQFLYFEAEPTVRGYLEKRYQGQGLRQAEAASLAFRNTHKVIYLCKQGKEFFQTGMESNLLVRPLLMYYGMVNFAKILVLTLDPEYPSNTALLAHGLTTRKIKKTQYQFMDDEVKIQQDGLLPHLIRLMTGKKCRESYKMRELLARIPELAYSYKKIYGQDELVHVYVSEHFSLDSPQTALYLPMRILDERKMGLESFCDWINGYNQSAAHFLPGGLHPQQGIFSLYWNHPEKVHVMDSPNGFCNRLFVKDLMGRDYLWLSPQEKLFLPEPILLYMIMYLLGMLCRYESDLWGELHYAFHSPDWSIIQEFLQAAARKFPHLVLNHLFEAAFYFER